MFPCVEVLPSKALLEIYLPWHVSIIRLEHGTVASLFAIQCPKRRWAGQIVMSEILEGNVNIDARAKMRSTSDSTSLFVC